MYFGEKVINAWVMFIDIVFPSQKVLTSCTASHQCLTRNQNLVMTHATAGPLLTISNVHRVSLMEYQMASDLLCVDLIIYKSLQK